MRRQSNAIGGLLTSACFWGLVLLTVILIVIAAGCAARPLPEGGVLVGIELPAGANVGLPTGGGSDALASAASGIGGLLAVAGVPGAGIVGAIIARILSSRGEQHRTTLAADAAAARARHEGERAGWDEAVREWKPPPGLAFGPASVDGGPRPGHTEAVA